jgi:hypothetical protein
MAVIPEMITTCNDMYTEEKHKQYVWKILLTGFLLVLSQKSVFSQLSLKQLDKIYRKNQVEEFEKILSNLHNETIMQWASISNNDTLIKINDLFNTILPERNKNELKKFFSFNHAHQQSLLMKLC